MLASSARYRRSPRRSTCCRPEIDLSARRPRRPRCRSVVGGAGDRLAMHWRAIDDVNEPGSLAARPSGSRRPRCRSRCRWVHCGGAVALRCARDRRRERDSVELEHEAEHHGRVRQPDQVEVVDGRAPHAGGDVGRSLRGSARREGDGVEGDPVASRRRTRSPHLRRGSTPPSTGPAPPSRWGARCLHVPCARWRGTRCRPPTSRWAWGSGWRRWPVTEPPGCPAGWRCPCRRCRLRPRPTTTCRTTRDRESAPGSSTGRVVQPAPSHR